MTLEGGTLQKTGRGGANKSSSASFGVATACLSVRWQLDEATSNVIAARSRFKRVAGASAHRKLVAAAAAWNCGDCVYPLAARREAEGRGGEGRPALDPGGGLRASSRQRPRRLPSTVLGSPHFLPSVPKAGFQVGAALLRSVPRPVSPTAAFSTFPIQNVSSNPS